jgi:uroporphyrin-3 C-methyltransferase
MNTENPMTETLPEPPTEEPAVEQKSASGLALLALIIAAGSLTGSAWLWYQSTTVDSGEAEQIAADSARQESRLGDLESQISGLDTRLVKVSNSDTGSRLSGIESKLDSLQATSGEIQSLRGETAAWTRSMQAAIESSQVRLTGAEARLASLSAREMDSNAEINLAEVDYILRLAQERLQLFGDTRTADHALQIADQHIAAFDNPMYIGVRQEINSARAQLAQVKVPDFVVLSQDLDGIQTGLRTVPFRTEKSITQDSPVEPGDGWWARVKNALSGLVTVRRNIETEDAVPVLADQELIRQRAWLEVEMARLAAMRRDHDNYVLALGRASDTLQKWFDPGAEQTRKLLQSLGNANQLLVDPQVPDISTPWTALQAIRTSGVAAPEQARTNQAPPMPAADNISEEQAETVTVDGGEIAE